MPKIWGAAAPQQNGQQVFLATDTAKLMKEVGLTPPSATTKSFSVMGKPFNPDRPEDYIMSFAIRRAA